MCKSLKTQTCEHYNELHFKEDFSESLLELEKSLSACSRQANVWIEGLVANTWDLNVSGTLGF